MVFLYNLVLFVGKVSNTLIQVYTYVVIAACLISFVNPDPYNPIVRFLRSATDPAFAFIKRYLPFVQIGQLDLSPIVLILGLQFISSVLINSLLGLILGSIRLQSGL